MKKLFLLVILTILSHSTFAADLTFNDTVNWLQKNLATLSDISNSTGETRINTIEIDNYGNTILKIISRDMKDGKIVSEMIEVSKFNLNDYKEVKSGLSVKKDCGIGQHNSFNCVLSFILADDAEKIKVETAYSDGEQITEMYSYFQIEFPNEHYANSFATAFVHLVNKVQASPF